MVQLSDVKEQASEGKRFLKLMYSVKLHIFTIFFKSYVTFMIVSSKISQKSKVTRFAALIACIL